MAELTRLALANKLNTDLAMLEALHREHLSLITTNEDRALLHITRKLHDIIFMLSQKKDS